MVTINDKFIKESRFKRALIRDVASERNRLESEGGNIPSTEDIIASMIRENKFNYKTLFRYHFLDIFEMLVSDENLIQIFQDITEKEHLIRTLKKDILMLQEKATNECAYIALGEIVKESKGV